MTKEIIRELVVSNDETTYSISHFKGIASESLIKSIQEEVKAILAPSEEEMDEYNTFNDELQNLLDGCIDECYFRGYTFKVCEVTQTKIEEKTPEEKFLDSADAIAKLDDNEKTLLLDIVHLLAREDYKPYAFNELYHTCRKYI